MVDWLIEKCFNFVNGFVEAGKEGERLADAAHAARQKQKINADREKEKEKENGNT